MLYVLDEPSIGLHPRETIRNCSILLQRCETWATAVLVVEHDEETIRRAETMFWILAREPEHTAAKSLRCGTASRVAANPNSITGLYMRGARKIEVPAERQPAQ